MAPTTETLEGGGFTGSPRDSEVFSSLLVSLKFLRQPPPVKTTWPPVIPSMYLWTSSWKSVTTVSLLDSKVQCISLERRQIWLREGRWLLSLGRYHVGKQRGWSHAGWSLRAAAFCAVFEVKACVSNKRGDKRQGRISMRASVSGV